MSNTDEESMADYWRDVKAARQEKRADNRKSSAEMLREAGIPFEAKNGDAHLIVRALGKTVDFWPGTGLWIVRGQQRRAYGVRKLIQACTPAGAAPRANPPKPDFNTSAEYITHHRKERMNTQTTTIADELDHAEPFRELDDHKVNPANDVIKIEVIDEPGSGGAHHAYQVSGYDCCGMDGTLITFQNGPINEVGVNGLTHEVLLAIVADRLRCFQKGPFATRYNALALTHIEEAQNWLNRRTLERMRRGVEGTHKV